MTQNRTVHINIDPTRVRSLLAKLSQTNAIALTDGGCDTGLLGAGWYIAAYTGRYANVVGFDAFIAKKSNLPIVVGITKFTLPSNLRAILLRHNEGVYNKGSQTTLLSEFQLRTRGCIVDSTYKGHRGADHKPGTQCIETTDDEDGTVYTIPLRLCDALMSFAISELTAEDLATLPIVDITPDGVWCPSDFNETGRGLSFTDSGFDPTCFAQLATVDDTATELFHDAVPNIPDLYPMPTTNPTPIPPPCTDDDPIFHDAQDHLLPNDGHFFDPADSTEHFGFIGRAFHLSLDPSTVIDSVDVDRFLMQLDHTELRGDHEDFDSFAYISRTASEELDTYVNNDIGLESVAFASKAAIQDRAHQYVEYLGYRPVDIVRKTLENTSQLAQTILQFLMRRHVRARFPWLNCNRLRETVATDTYFANTRAIGGATCAQVFYGVQSYMINVYGMKSESEMPEVYKDFIREEGAPTILRRDNSQIQSGKRTTSLNREYVIKDEFTEPGHPQQNPAELRAVKFVKNHSQVLLDRTGAPENCWLLACEYIADVHNMCADESIGYRIPREVRHGGLQDISAFVEYRFYEPILYLDSDETFPSSKEKPGWWVGVANNVGDAMTFKILTEDTHKVIHRSVIRPAKDDRFKNKCVRFEPDSDTNPKDEDDDDDAPGLVFARRRLKIDRGLSRRTKRKQLRRQIRRPNSIHPVEQMDQQSTYPFLPIQNSMLMGGR